MAIWASGNGTGHQRWGLESETWTGVTTHYYCMLGLVTCLQLAYQCIDLRLDLRLAFKDLTLPRDLMLATCDVQPAQAVVHVISVTV